MLTTIRINGHEGLRFLSVLGATFRGSLPPALAAMVERASRRAAQPPVELELETEMAEEVEAFVHELVGAGFARGESLPLLFSPQVGDVVVIARDLLVEFKVNVKRGMPAPRIWRYVGRGTRGRLVARREGRKQLAEGGDSGTVQLLDGPHAQELAYIGDASMTRTRSLRRSG
ncbi:MAG TPA: hypothetical protein VFQ53_08175 [Kofleriaceae bacterium]|nr:hypothetical protein [Kofleriaceae bacterium]